MIFYGQPCHLHFSIRFIFLMYLASYDLFFILLFIDQPKGSATAFGLGYTVPLFGGVFPIQTGSLVWTFCFHPMPKVASKTFNRPNQTGAFCFKLRHKHLFSLKLFDNLLVANNSITHHGDAITADEELSPTLENLVVLTWLRLIHSDLPSLVKQRYGTELRSRTLASLKPEISQALDSLLEEIRSTTDSKVLRTTAARFRQFPPRPSYKLSPQPWASNKRPKSCPLCKQAGRNDQHFLSTCSSLPPENRTYLSRSRLTSALDDEEPDYAEYTPSPFPDEHDHTQCASARIVSRCVSTKQSPHFKAFYKHHPLRLTLDTGAETSMIKSSVAHPIGAPIKQSSQQALQANGVTPLAVAGETCLILSRAEKQLALDALVVDDLDVDILAGTPFLIANDITVRPAKCQVRI